MHDTATTPTIYRVVFRPARNGAGVNCRLPNGKIAFPSRFYWNQPDPQPYEIWEVAECGGYPNVGYVKPLRRLAEAPLGQSQSARVATQGLLNLATFWVALRQLFVPRPNAHRVPPTLAKHHAKAAAPGCEVAHWEAP